MLTSVRGKGTKRDPKKKSCPAEARGSLSNPEHPGHPTLQHNKLNGAAAWLRLLGRKYTPSQVCLISLLPLLVLFPTNFPDPPTPIYIFGSTSKALSTFQLIDSSRVFEPLSPSQKPRFSFTEVMGKGPVNSQIL